MILNLQQDFLLVYLLLLVNFQQIQLKKINLGNPCFNVIIISGIKLKINLKKFFIPNNFVKSTIYFNTKKKFCHHKILRFLDYVLKFYLLNLVIKLYLSKNYQ